MSAWRIAFFAGLAAVAAPAAAGAQLEIVTLRHRPAEQVLSGLQPFVEPGGAVSSLGDKILLRVSPANLAELRTAITALDTPLRQLVLSVRQGRAWHGQGDGVGVSVHGSRVEIQGGSADSQREDTVSQQVQVLEGGRALIRVGQSLPLVMREWRATPGGWVQVDSMRRADVGSGFYALPQVLGDRVNVEISPSLERIGPDGVVESARLTTTVSGPLGAWIPLGASQSDTHRADYGSTGLARSSSQSGGQVWLRVDAIE